MTIVKVELYQTRCAFYEVYITCQKIMNLPFGKIRGRAKYAMKDMVGEAN